MGRTLDWLYAHDPTKLFAGISPYPTGVWHSNPTDSCGYDVLLREWEYTQATTQALRATGPGEAGTADPALIAITYGYSRDHRKDLNEWMLALALTHDGDIPIFLQLLDGNSSDKVSLLAAIQAIQEQLHATDKAPSISVADNGVSRSISSCCS